MIKTKDLFQARQGEDGEYDRHSRAIFPPSSFLEEPTPDCGDLEDQTGEEPACVTQSQPRHQREGWQWWCVHGEEKGWRALRKHFYSDKNMEVFEKECHPLALAYVTDYCCIRVRSSEKRPKKLQKSHPRFLTVPNWTRAGNSLIPESTCEVPESFTI